MKKKRVFKRRNLKLLTKVALLSVLCISRMLITRNFRMLHMGKKKYGVLTVTTAVSAHDLKTHPISY